MSPAPRHLILLAAVLLLVAGCLLQILAGYSKREDLTGDAWGCDDAYISYRYARHLAAGEGLVYNPGERVEGFSNLLYVLLLTPAAALAGADRLYAVSAALNLLFALAALVIFHRYARRRLGDPAAAAAAVLFALTPSLWVAVASGLETPLVLLIQIGIWIAVEEALALRSPHSPDPSLPEEERGRQRQEKVLVSDAPASAVLPPLPLGEGRGGEGFGGDTAALAALSLLAALSVLTRVDGFLVPLLAAVFLALRGRRRAAFVVAGVTLATLGALTLWRLSYYGWPLPNTYYAKVDGPLRLRTESGLLQLASAALGTGLLFYLAVFAVAGFRNLKDRAGLQFPMVFAAAWLAYFVYIGGDHFYDRFLVVLFPMGAFLLLELAREMPRPKLAVLVTLVLALQLVALWTDPRFAYSSSKYDRWVLLGRHLGRAHPGAVLAIDGAGKVPYFSGLRTIDMLGLTDVHIGHGETKESAYFWPGHAKSDLGYVLSRRPDLIANWLGDVWSLRAGPVPEPAALAEAGYRLIYLVNTDPRPRARNILDVRHAGPDEVFRRVEEGYRYGVFARAGERRRASNSTSAAATVTLRDSTGGSMGIVKRRSTRSSRAGERPAPSAPTARTRVPSSGAQ